MKLVVGAEELLAGIDSAKGMAAREGFDCEKVIGL